MNARARRSNIDRASDAPTIRARRARARRRFASMLAAVALAAVGALAPLEVSPTGAEAGVPSDAGLDPALVDQLEAALDEGFAASGMPGVTVGLWIPGHGEWISTRGVSDTTSMTPMERANQAKIGSITKTVLGTVALQVIGDGDLGLTLDDTIDEWYPDFPEADQITVRMLLNMTSGVGEPGQAQLDRICADPYSTITPDEVIAIGAATPREAYAPGAGFTYSGFNYFLAGRILEKVTGTDLPTLIETNLLAPLGMDRSRFAPDGQLSAPLNRGYSGFCPERPQPTDTTDWYNHESWAAGAMLSTIDDLHTWGLALGEGYGIAPDLFAARLEDGFEGPAGREFTYGLGVGVHRDLATDCVLDLSHLGAEPGYGADVHYFSTTGSVFALMGNGDGGTGVASLDVLAALLPVMTPEVTIVPTESCVPPAPAPTPTTVTSGPVIAMTVTPTFTG